MFGKDKNKKYELDQEINSGGEGIVYSIVGYPNLVAKVYRAERLSDSSLMKSIEEKILVMLDMNFDPRIDGDLIVAWPTDALYDSSGYFLGYAMPIINNMKSLIWAMRPSDRNILWPKGYRWHNSVAIAFNLSVVIEKLHAAGIVVGDMNTNNILIDPTGNVTMIDAGSFNIRTKEGKLCKCIVGFPEVLPPELQGKDLTKPNNQFSEKTDCFALAIHIFTLLNNNCHPFGCLNYNTEHTSSSSPKIMDNIVNGYCPYVNGETKSTVVDSLGMAMFSDDINALFKRAFHYDAITAVKQSTIDNRPTAKEWREALAKFYSAGFITCTKNPIHEYSKKYNGGCPWCAIEFKKSSNANAGTDTVPGARTTGTIPNAGTGTAPGTRTTGTVPKAGTGTATGTLPVKHKTIPIKYCDLDGNTLHTSQIDVEYGKTAYAYAIDINGYHLFGNNARSEISVNANGYTSQKEIRFVYEKNREKKKDKHKFLRFLFVIAILYCLIMYGMINSAVTNKEYEKALEYMGAFPFYKTLFLDEYNNVKNEVKIIEDQRRDKRRKDSIKLPYGIRPEMTSDEAHNKMMQAGFTLNFTIGDSYYYKSSLISGWYKANFSTLTKTNNSMEVSLFFSEESMGNQITLSTAYRNIRSSLIDSYGQPSEKNTDYNENWRSSNSRYYIHLLQTASDVVVVYTYYYPKN